MFEIQFHKLKLFHLFIDSEWVVVEEGRVSRQHLVDEDAQGPPVDSLVVAFALDDLRGQVLGGAAQGPGSVSHPLGEPEVGDLEVALPVEKQVFRLEVSVDDGKRVKVVEGRDDLDRVEQRRGRVEASGTRDVKVGIKN